VSTKVFQKYKINKSSAVAEKGDCAGAVGLEVEEGGCCPLSVRGERWVPF